MSAPDTPANIVVELATAAAAKEEAIAALGRQQVALLRQLRDLHQQVQDLAADCEALQAQLAAAQRDGVVFTPAQADAMEYCRQRTQVAEQDYQHSATAIAALSPTE